MSVTHSYRKNLIALKEGHTYKFHKNKITLIIGPNGSGKSTLFKLLAQLITPSRGSIQVVSPHPQVLLRQKTLCSLYNPDTLVFNIFLTVQENIDLLYLTQDSSFGESVQTAFRLFDLDFDQMRSIRLASSKQFNNMESFSKLSLIMVLLQSNPFLLLDEPFEFLNSIQKMRFLNYLQEIKHRRTVIVCTHNLSSLPRFSDYIYLLQFGNILKEGAPSSILRGFNNLVKATLLLSSSHKEGAGQSFASLQREIYQQSQLSLILQDENSISFFGKWKEIQELLANIEEGGILVNIATEPLEYFMLKEIKGDEDIENNILPINKEFQKLKENCAHNFISLKQKLQENRGMTFSNTSYKRVLSRFFSSLYFGNKFAIFFFFSYLALLNIFTGSVILVNHSWDYQFGYQFGYLFSSVVFNLIFSAIFGFAMITLLHATIRQLFKNLSPGRRSPHKLVCQVLSIVCAFYLGLAFLSVPLWMFGTAFEIIVYILDQFKNFSLFGLLAEYFFYRGKIWSLVLIICLYVIFTTLYCLLQPFDSFSAAVEYLISFFPFISSFYLLAYPNPGVFQYWPILCCYALFSLLFLFLNFRLLANLNRSKQKNQSEAQNSNHQAHETYQFLHSIDFNHEDLSLQFNLERGQLAQIVTASGQTRSLLISLLSLKETPIQGTVTYFRGQEEILQSGLPSIGLCSEAENNFQESLTVNENLRFYGHLNSLEKEVIEDLTVFFLTELRMTDFRDTRAQELSSGNRQKLKCIMAMFCLPELLILEAPTEGLDYFSIQTFHRLLRVFMDHGASVIMVNVRPSELIYSASFAAFLNEREGTLTGRPLDTLSSQSRQEMIVKVCPRYLEDAPSKTELRFLEIMGELEIEAVANWRVNEVVHCSFKAISMTELMRAVRALESMKKAKVIEDFEIGFIDLESLNFLQQQGY